MEEKSEKKDQELENAERVFEDFSADEFKSFLAENYHAEPKRFEPTATNIGKFPILTIHPRDYTGVLAIEGAQTIDIAAKVRKELFTRKREDE